MVLHLRSAQRFGFVPSSAPKKDQRARRGQPYPAAIKWGEPKKDEVDGAKEPRTQTTGDEVGDRMAADGWFNPLTYKGGQSHLL